MAAGGEKENAFAVLHKIALGRWAKTEARDTDESNDSGPSKGYRSLGSSDPFPSLSPSHPLPTVLLCVSNICNILIIFRSLYINSVTEAKFLGDFFTRGFVHLTLRKESRTRSVKKKATVTPRLFDSHSLTKAV